jgi:hypothetical protein
MFGLGPATRIYVAAEPVDMRKGFEGLHGLVRDHLGHDPLSGHLFLFTNRSRTRLKGAGMGWQRTMGVQQTFGERTISLARGGGSAQRQHAAGRVGDVDQRPGSKPGENATQLATRRACCIEHTPT